MIGHIIVDLMFGDSGKGITTDYLCSRFNPSYTIVVRYNGGHQAGHTVHIGDKSHVFSNFGSGSFRGIPTYFTEHCTMYPVTMWNEKKILKTKGVDPVVYFHPLAKLTTPYDVMYNRIIERKNNHGSCGLGVGATMSRNNDTGYKLYVVDLTNKNLLKIKLNQIYHYYREKLPTVIDRETYDEMCGPEIKLYYDAIDNLDIIISPYQHLKNYEHLVFEGAQGILLDMNHGIFPNVTYGNTTSKNAIEICDILGIDCRRIIYVTRCYQTRHGIGWMSDNSNIKLINNENEINQYNKWQGDFRIGELDYDLLKYAIKVDTIYSKTALRWLMVTCLDQRPDFIFDYNKLKDILFSHTYNSYSPDSKDIVSINPKVIKNQHYKS